MTDLAKRAVACKRWRWMPGALEDTAWRLIAEDSPGVWCMSNAAVVGRVSKRPTLPDLQDPATLGCLLALVREAWGDPGICVRGMLQSDGRYQWYVVGGHAHGGKFSRLGIYNTEAEALVAALEAAP